MSVEMVLLTLFVVAVVVVISGVAAVAMARNLLYICQPSEALVFSGRGDGVRGYRTVRGGRGWRVPLIEQVDRLDLTNMIIDVSVQNAYSSGGIPLSIHGVANVKIGSHDPVLGNAVERLLGKSREEIARIAKDVLEGNLRGVLSRLTPEEVNEDKIRFAEKLLDEAEPDLAKLGLVLDTMKIQNVHDERGYLNSLGRRQSAEVVKKARIAEANGKADAIMKDAENHQRARFREIESSVEIARARSERRIADARSKGEALVAEAVGEVNALVARAEAAIGAEVARVEQTRFQLEADVIQPAQAAMNAEISAAYGRASRILEQGRATAKVLDEMVTVWKQAGDSARDIFLMQKYQSVLAQLSESVGIIPIDRVTVIPSGGDEIAGRAVRLVQELKGTLGVDLPKMLADATQGRSEGNGPTGA